MNVTFVLGDLLRTGYTNPFTPQPISRRLCVCVRFSRLSSLSLSLTVAYLLLHFRHLQNDFEPVSGCLGGVKYLAYDFT